MSHIIGRFKRKSNKRNIMLLELFFNFDNKVIFLRKRPREHINLVDYLNSISATFS
ncbi:hypothetical protein LguiA_034030 [Lonicera macranthoides]